MVKYRLEYYDGCVCIKDFLSDQSAQWFIHNEIDYLICATKIR